VLEQALGQVASPTAWVSCSEAERAPGALLARIMHAIATSVPGASDALAERLAAAPDRVDALAATNELLAELSRLLVEPLVLVLDDAEHLDGADESLQLLERLIRAEGSPLRVAVASRRPLELRIAKPRGAGRVTAVTAVELAFDVEECAALIKARSGHDSPPDQVGAVMEATEGWPLGVALASSLVEARPPADGNTMSLRTLRSAPDLRAYLAEELLESLDPELREAATSSSVAAVVTPGVSSALDLPPPDLAARVERAGVLIRRVSDGGAFTYHPLLREFLLERLDERGPDARRMLHAAVAPVVAQEGDHTRAIEHWLAAESWQEAVSAIERESMPLVRTQPDLLRHWLSRLPPDVGSLPTTRALHGQLDWGAGDHAKAIEAFQAAIRAFPDHPNPAAEWMARFACADALFSVGRYDEIRQLLDGWDGPGATGAGMFPLATAMYSALLLATFGRFEESEEVAAALSEHPAWAAVASLEAMRQCFVDTPRGRLEEAYAGLESAIGALEGNDPFHRSLYMRASQALALHDLGRLEDALSTWRRIREGAREAAARFLVDTSYAWGALLLAQLGRLQEAEAELARHERHEAGWRDHVGDLAEAWTASLRGDTARTIACAEKVLTTVAPGLPMFRYWARADLVPPLVAAGRVDRADALLDEARAVIDEAFPGADGRYTRARLLALRAWLRHLDGDHGRSDAELLAAWEEAGDSLPHVLRREWPRIEAVVWGALERGVIDPQTGVAAIAAAFPDGAPLVAFLDHADAGVRLAALPVAVRSGDPRALTQLEGLARDPDRRVADAAGRLRSRPLVSVPPLRFELLGGFAVRRGSWVADEGAWGRPVDARLVRFLLVQLDRPASEDELFEALWPNLSVESARRSLQVAASRVRGVLDPPGAQASVLERAGRSYRMALGPSDTVDADQFRAAAAAALAERGEGRRRLLERARSLWGGEPLPEERYSDWAAAYREGLIDRYTAVLTASVELDQGEGDHVGAADTARELVRLDPLNEGAHRALMTAYARAGRTGHALRQYLECRSALVETLGTEPAEATSRLQARILAGEAV
jgi:ATP/maltotriose-dependent transcriptional regulator MalT/DNA-binding SARP family transcriptional activator